MNLVLEGEKRHGYRRAPAGVYLSFAGESAHSAEQGARSLRVLVVASIAWMIGATIALRRGC